MDDALTAGTANAGDWRPKVRSASSRDRHELRRRGGYYVELAGPTDSGSGQLILHVTLEAESQVGPLHLHRHATNTYVVLQGRLTVSTEVGRVDLVAHEALTVPPGIGHGTSNPTSDITTFLAIYDRPISDDFEELE